MVIHESAEDYLETILMLSKKLPVVRSIDIANEMPGASATRSRQIRSAVSEIPLPSIR